MVAVQCQKPNNVFCIGLNIIWMGRFGFIYFLIFLSM